MNWKFQLLNVLCVVNLLTQGGCSSNEIRVVTPKQFVEQTLLTVNESRSEVPLLEVVDWNRAFDEFKSSKLESNKFNTPETMRAFYMKKAQPGFFQIVLDDAIEAVREQKYKGEISEKQFSEKLREKERLVQSMRKGENLVRQGLQKLSCNIEESEPLDPTFAEVKVDCHVNVEGVEQSGENTVRLVSNNDSWLFVNPNIWDLLGFH